MSNSFKNWNDLAKYLSSHYRVVGDPNTASKSQENTNSSSVVDSSAVAKTTKKTKPPITKVEIRKRTQELLSDIRRECSSPPWNLHGILDNGQIKITDQPDGTIIVTVPFSSRAYKKNLIKSQSHYSFIPVLMSRGWSVHGATGPRTILEQYHGPAKWEEKKHREVYGGTNNKKIAVWKYGRPTFEYFVGTGKLDDVINQFNRKYASDGFFASLECDENTVGWVPGHYITSL